MASRIGPRSVKDATRFTSTIPHATSKSATSAAPKASRIPGETPEQRVRRLRQAHLAAQKAQVSKADRVIDASRRFFDVAHRWTVGGLSCLQKPNANSRPTSSPPHVWRTSRATPPRSKSPSSRRPTERPRRRAFACPLLSPPEHRTHFEEHVKTAFDAGKATESKGKGLLGFLWGGSNAGTENSTSAAAQSVGDAAKDAWEKEKQNQQNGGSLDQLALETGSSAAPEPKKKGWW
ncbi:hypothetical protein TrVFT333_004090 [Trichoderma virens FT-333]|nr:hypothetical protein TrVFT333_004090 [Trichoderma virens FT-333]